MIKRLFIIVTTLFGLMGCIQEEHSTTLYPDGSGKLVFITAAKKDMFLPGDMTIVRVVPFEDADKPDLENVEKNNEGIIAWSEPKREEDNDWIRYTATGYFEDIRKVKIDSKDKKSGERALMTSFELQKTDSGQILLMRSNVGRDVKGAKIATKKDREMLKQMVK